MSVMLDGPDFESWQPHALHDELGDPWFVSNCYADLWIELLHWLGFDPVAAFSHCMAIGYEGRNWTFHKPPLRDLYSIYGLDVSEFNVWLDIEEHIEEQIHLGRAVLIEADSFFLPDTEATAYRKRHQKTTIAVVGIDRANAKLWFFHDSGFHTLHGDDYVGIFRGGSFPLPPYFEIVKLHQGKDSDEMWEPALDVARLHLQRVPRTNPLTQYSRSIANELDALARGDFDFYDWAFSTVRQAGSAYQYAAAFCNSAVGCDLRQAGTHFMEASTLLKGLMMQVARANKKQRVMDSFPALDDAADCWEDAICAARTGLGVLVAAK